LERSEIVRELQELAPHDHAVLFYSDINAKRALIFPFLEEAFDKQGLAVYATCHEPLDEVRGAIRRWGINVDRQEYENSLRICDYQRVTSPNGRLNSVKVDQWLVEAAKRGGPVRVASDLTLLVKRGMVDEIVRQERALGRRLKLPLTLICAYEESVTDTRNGEFLIEMLRAHSHVVFPSIAMPLI